MFPTTHEVLDFYVLSNNLIWANEVADLDTLAIDSLVTFIEVIRKWGS